MKCPRCKTTIKHWRLLEDPVQADDAQPPDTHEEDEEESMDYEDDDDEIIHIRTGQCTKCFAYCSQIIGVGEKCDKHPVILEVGDLDRLYSGLF
jgi:hypothetical protein